MIPKRKLVGIIIILLFGLLVLTSITVFVLAMFSGDWTLAIYSGVAFIILYLYKDNVATRLRKYIGSR